MMDINKEKELFLTHMRRIGSARFMFELDEDGNFDDMSMAYAWSAWQAAKAQAVPEGYKLVPIDSVAVNKKEIPAIREALHIMNFKHGDVRCDFASADAAIVKAIEATQEPANDRAKD